MAGLPPTAYTPYASKRQSTGGAAPASPSRSPALTRPGAGTSWSEPSSPIKSPQPVRVASVAATSNGFTSPARIVSTSARPTPPPASHSATLPFQSVPQGASPFPPSTPNRVSSPGIGRPSSAGSAHSPRNRNASERQQQLPQEKAKAPFHSSFQPSGVRRDRTDEFLSKRRAKGEGKKLEEGRLGRRLEKLVALHFPPPTDSLEPSKSHARTSSTLSSISEFGGTLRGIRASELWKSVAGGKSEAEMAEQAIVKWQEDSEATRCCICMAPFGLKTRRHHCRLCGRVVCFLPPTPIVPPSSDPEAPPPIPMPTRRERCSTFFTYEYQSMVVSGEKKPIGVVTEIEQVEQDLVFLDGGPAARERDDRKRVRACRECLNVVLRQQAKTLPVRIPTWVKLYEVLVQLEAEIDESLPEFQELILGVQNPGMVQTSQPSAAAAQTLRKRLLTNLASYDTISKRIRDLPLADPGLVNGAQDRLQRAIAQRATLFLSTKLGLLRQLGSLDEAPGKEKKKKGHGESHGVRSLASLLGNESESSGSEAAGQLAVLLEQAELVRGYFEDANARRQFEDARILEESLHELRQEIERVRASL